MCPKICVFKKKKTPGKLFILIYFYLFSCLLVLTYPLAPGLYSSEHLHTSLADSSICSKSFHLPSSLLPLKTTEVIHARVPTSRELTRDNICKVSFTRCGSLNKNGPHRIMYLNA